jgi:hypothetical protein
MFLITTLRAPYKGDLSQGILRAIGMGIYRVQRQMTMQIHLPDVYAEIDAVPVTSGGGKTRDWFGSAL